MPLMTTDEYLKKHKTFPYVFKIEKDGAQLFYFGERHSYDSKDPQWNELRLFWSEFLKGTNGRKRIVFIEGGLRAILRTEDEMVATSSGGGLVTLWAHDENVEVHSPEPNEAYERSLLEKAFSRDEIQYYYFARIAYQWHCLVPESRRPFEEYVREYLLRDKHRSGWDDYDFSFEHMQQIHQELLGEPFEEGNSKKSWGDITHPYVPNTVINAVSRRSSEIRDEYIVQQIVKHVDAGYSLFVEYGGSHAVVQEPCLRELLS